MKNNLAFISVFLILFNCASENNDLVPSVENNYKTENVVIVIIDGPRFSDTWNSSGRINIPFQSAMASEGVFFNNFFNDGSTYTLPGHTAITTGNYEFIVNDGSEIPSSPSIFQHYLSHSSLPPTKTWIITSKSKLEVLAATKDIDWRGSFLPSISAVDRPDEETLNVTLNILDKDQPNLTMVHFKGPDVNGHAKNWEGYINSIQETDRLTHDLWEYIQTDDHYKNNTALLISNDHGRHLNGINTGFVGHGDRCEGCRHIYLLALGPDFNKGEVVESVYGQIDIAPTIANLLSFPWQGEGHPITELLK